jgi:tetratricopeptide (TPR) repeat protein
MLRRLHADGLMRSSPLAALDRQAVAALTQYALGNDASAEKVQQIYDVTDGNALFVNQALQSLEADGTLRGTTLQQLVTDRFEGLPEAAKTLAGAASVLSGGFELEIARDVCGWNERETLDALDLLLDQKLVAYGTTRSRSAFAFVHELIREVVYERTSAQLRDLSHRRAARALGRIYADRLDEVAAERALHYERAGMSDECAEQYLRAARHAAKLFANRDVLHATERGLAHASGAATRFELLKLREETNVRCGDALAALADVAALERCAQELGDENALAEAFRRTVAAHQRSGDMEAAAHAIEILGSLSVSSGSPSLIAGAKLAAATHLLRGGRIKETTIALRAALDAYRIIGDKPNQALVLGQLAEIGALAGDAETVDVSILQSREIAEAIRDRGLLAVVLGHHARAAHHLRRYRRLREVASELLLIAREIGDVGAEAQALTSFANASVALFELENAEEGYQRAAVLHERSENRLGSAVVSANRGALLGRVGDWERALSFTSAARAAFASLGDLPREMSTTFNEAQICLELNDAPRALELARRAQELAHVHGGAPLEAAALGLIGICQRRLGQMDEAISHLQQSVDRSSDLPNATERASILAELVLALLDAGRIDEALAAAKQLEPLEPHREDWKELSHPQVIPWAVSRAYRAVGAMEAAESALDCARTVTRDRLEHIRNTRWRNCYEDWQLNRSIFGDAGG